MANYTAIATGAAANASTINAPLGQLDAALGNMAGVPTTNKNAAGAIAELYTGIVGLQGGASVSNAQLVAWTEAEAYQVNAVTYSGTYTNTVQSATVVWPDGSTGTFTATTINATYEAIDAYTITHATSGKTVTQAAVTRNGDGNVTVKPVLTIA